MRLTLRTLLAYLDDVLEPAQTKEIGAKIAESSAAVSLVGHIRDVMRRRRLTAPELRGPGSGLDPNTVAEYLDNTLPPESVADVEKVCLESDVHLAEVAACHQILTLVLGEPVEISFESRERMYALGPVAAHQQVGGGPAGGSPTNGHSQPAGTSQAAQKPGFHETIPDYLKPRPLWKRVLPYAAIALVAGAWLGLLGLDPSLIPSYLGGRNEGTTSPSDTSNEALALVVPDPVVEVADDGNAMDDGAVNDPGSDRSVPRPAEPEPEAEPVAAAENSAETVRIDPPPPPDEAADDRPILADEPPVNIFVPPLPAESGLDGDQVVVTETKIPPIPSDRLPPKPVEEQPPVGPQPTAAEPAEPLQPVPRPVEPATPSPKFPRIEYTSLSGVLLNELRDSEQWRALPHRSIIHEGERIACPEPFDAILKVGTGMCRATLRGGAAVQLLGVSQAGPFGFGIEEGRLVLENRKVGTENDNSERVALGIEIQGELCQLELMTGDTVCGLEIVPEEPDQFEQEFTKEKAYTGGLYVLSGSVRFADGTGRVHMIGEKSWLSLTPQNRAALADPEIPATFTPLLTVPQWLVSDEQSTSAIMRRYAGLFEEEFNRDQPIAMTIPAVIQSPRPMISELAVKCLALTGSHQALVQALARAEHEEARLAAIVGLRRWLFKAPENKDLLKEDLQQRFHPEEANIIYELLWGYDEDDLMRTEPLPTPSMRLVEWLGHNHIAVRELAFYHIYRLTGRKYDYRPLSSPAHRNRAIERWQSELAGSGALLGPNQPPMAASEP